MKVYGEMDTQLHILLILALLGSKWSASHHNHFTPWCTHWVGAWVGPTGGLANVQKIWFVILLGHEFQPPISSHGIVCATMTLSFWLGLLKTYRTAYHKSFYQHWMHKFQTLSIKGNNFDNVLTLSNICMYILIYMACHNTYCNVLWWIHCVIRHCNSLLVTKFQALNIHAFT
jgi:hypothetical protein